MERIVLSALLALAAVTAGCAKFIFEHGGSMQPYVDGRPSVEKFMEELSWKTGARLGGCYGISTVFQRTCNFFNIDGAQLEAYLAKAGWTRTSGEAELHGFRRDGLLLTYEKLERGIVAVTVRTQ